VELILALDQGSSSSRALAVDAKGEVLARAQRKIGTTHPKAGWAEHDAAEIAASQEWALKTVLKKLPKAASVLGLGVGTQRSTVVFWDKKTGKPACPAPSWQDGRAADGMALLASQQAEVHDKTGLYLTPYYSAPKIRWFMVNEPSVKKLLDEGRLMVGPVSTYLIWRLTRGEVYACDPTTAQRMLLFNIRTFRWDPDLLKLFQIPEEILPAIRPSGGDWGEYEGIPIRACLGDQQAAALGLGAREGTGILNYGTGAFLLLHTGTQQHRVPGLLTSVGCQLERESPTFLEEGTVHAAGTSLDWLRGLGLLDGKDVDPICRRSKNRVLFLNAIGGLGAPRWDYATKTTFFGLNSQTTRDDLARAVVESLGFLISDIAATLRQSGLSATEFRAAGGLSRVDYLLEFQSSLLGAPVSRCQEPETTALGVATLAAQAARAGWAPFPLELDRRFTPSLDPAEAARLNGNWRRFIETQAQLSREI
jgi:glycerol kinase